MAAQKGRAPPGQGPSASGGGGGGQQGPSTKVLQDFKKWQYERMVKEKVTETVTRVLQDKEREVDDKLESLNNLCKEDMEELRKKRLDMLKRKAETREKWIQNAHGTVHKIKDQKEFFNLVKKSKYVICIFRNDTNKYATMLYEHLTILARKHIECKFVDMNIEDVPFLVQRLNIYMTPTLLLAKDYKVDRQLVGLDWVAPDGKLDTLKLEQKLFDFGFFEETSLGLEKQLKALRKKEKQDEEDSDSDLDI